MKIAAKNAKDREEKKNNFYRSILFILVGIVIFLLLETYVFKQTRVDQEIYDVIKLADTAGPFPEVIIGDSVARQLFPTGPGKKSLYLTSNQAISMVGQYILVDKYITRFPGQVKDVIAILHPYSFTNNLDQKWSFNYFFLPFFTRENDRYFSPLVFSLMENCKYCYLYRQGFIKKFIKKHLEHFQVDFSSLDNHPFEFTGYSTVDRIYLTPIALEYLKKLDELCKQNQIKLHLFCPPISRVFNSDYSFMKIQLRENGLTEMFSDYFAKMLLLKDDAFKHDLIHYKTRYHKRFGKTIIRNMKTGSIEFPDTPGDPLPSLKYKWTLPNAFSVLRNRKPVFVDSFETLSFLPGSDSKSDFDISTYSLGNPEKAKALKLTTTKPNTAIRPIYNLCSASGPGIKAKPGDRIYFTVWIKGNFSINVNNEIFITEPGVKKAAAKFFLSKDWVEYRVTLEVQKGDSPLYAGISFSGKEKGEALEIKEPKLFVGD